MAKFVHLSSDILLHLFTDHFTLQQLFHLRALNCHLCTLIEYSIGKRQSLKLFWSFLDVQHYTDHMFHWKLEDDPALLLRNQLDDDLILCGTKFTRSTADWLERMFPLLNHLLIVFNNYPVHPPPTHQYPSLPYLISRWTGSLVRLTLFGNFSPISNQKQFVDELCHRISQAPPSLKHLDIYNDGMFYYANARRTRDQDDPFVNIPIDLTSRFLSQLERLNLLTQRPNNTPEYVLRTLSSSQEKSLTKQQLHIFYHDRKELLSQLEEMRNDEATKFVTSETITKLTFFAGQYRLKYSPALDRIVALFTQLCSFCLEQMRRGENEITVTEVLNKLSSLQHLRELKLRNLDLSQLQDIQLTQPRLRMRTITHLTIQNDTFKPPQIESLSCAVFFASIEHIFPSIRSFYLKLDTTLTEQIDPNKHLIACYKLTQFELSVYAKFRVAVPHLLSVKHRRRFEQETVPAQPVDRIGAGQVGWESWRRRQAKIGLNSEEDSEHAKEKKMNLIWTKEKTMVYDALRMKQIYDSMVSGGTTD